MKKSPRESRFIGERKGESKKSARSHYNNNSETSAFGAISVFARRAPFPHYNIAQIPEELKLPFKGDPSANKQKRPLIFSLQ
jgi:hypothetical protein